MIVINTALPKLCHAQAGDVVRITDSCGELLPALYLVSVFNEKGKRAGRPGLLHGLYDDERPFFLVDLATGVAQPMPHLSSRVQIVRNVAVYEGCQT
jgi:hypothetical protein